MHGYRGRPDAAGAVSHPIYQSATFAHPGLHRSTGFAYSRCGNPTVLELENTIAMLEGGLKALAYCSGMAAISSAIKLFESGDVVLVSDDLYGGTHRLFQDVYAPRYGIRFQPVDFSNLASVREACERVGGNVAAFFVETPTNPLMKVADIRALAGLAHERGAILIVDNTFLTCYFQQPLELGADLVVYSGTKYLCGHNDVICGFMVVRDEVLLERVFMDYMSEGDALAPFEAWLMLRSLKTLPLRLDAQQERAKTICEFLHGHPHVTDVLYVGDPQHPSYDLSCRQASGFGAMISFYVDTPERAKHVLEHVQVIAFAESLGGVESLITYPAVQTHGSIPEARRNELGITDTLLRLSVGVEDAADLIDDLDQALA
ncbi:MAG TPA: cystathionine gamma-synthase [Eggerthellaceae bacterium]|nr:cystathionine gamma-synthase [Eggerthellaceae bacterium]